MPIKSINEDILERACPVCSRVESHEIGDLTLGAADPIRRYPWIIRLPPCGCGAVEVLMPAFEELPAELAGSYADLHRRAVGALANRLRAIGRDHPETKKSQASAQPCAMQLGRSTIRLDPPRQASSKKA